MRVWKIVLLALGGLRRTPLRVALTALGVAIASGALVSMMAFAMGLQRQIETPLKLLALLNDINVSPAEGNQARGAPLLDDAALERLAHLPGVTAAYPNIRVRDVNVRYGKITQNCMAVGAPREASLLGVTNEILVAGRYFSQSHDPEIVVGAQLAHSLGFPAPRDALGVSVTLEAGGLAPEGAESFAYRRKDLVLKVVGVYQLPAMVPGFAQQGVLVPVDLMKEVPGVRLESALSQLKAGGSAVSDTYGSVTVRVRDQADLAAIGEQIGKMGFHAHTMLSHFHEMQTFFIFLQVLLAAVGTVALTVAALGIVNTLLMSVLERYQEIGVYKAIGASDGDLVVLFLTEAAMIGLLGALGGLLLGRTVSYGFEIAVNVYARRQGAMEPLNVFAFPLWLLLATTLFAVVISVVAGVYPALRAARVDPIRALRRG